VHDNDQAAQGAMVLNTIARTGKVLRLFTPECPEWGVTEVAYALGLPKSNAHDLLSSLSAIGLLQRTPHNRYRLGWRLLAMSRNLVQGAGFRQQSTVVVGSIARQLGVATTLASWDGHRIVCVESAVAPGAVYHPEIGTGVRLPGHSSALGKVVLAHRSWEEVVKKVETYGLPKFTPGTVGDLGALRAQLREACDKGIAFDWAETCEGVACVAAPIFDARAFVVAALSISCRTEQLNRNRDDYARAVSGAARRLSAALRSDDLASAPPQSVPFGSPSSMTARS
jgi:DNA-binding IclR family transcriptional regulator